MKLNNVKLLTLFIALSMSWSNLSAQTINIEKGEYLLKQASTNQLMKLKKDGSVSPWRPILSVNEDAPKRWRIEPVSNNTFRMKSANVYLGIEVVGKVHEIRGYTPKSGRDIDWEFSVAAEGKILIKHIGSGLFLTHTSKGVVYGTDNRSEAIEFDVLKPGAKVKSLSGFGSDWHNVSFRNSKGKLSSSQGMLNGDIVENRREAKGDYALWKVIVSGGKYQIQNKENGFYLSSKGAIAEGSRVRIVSAPDDFGSWSFTFMDGVVSCKHEKSGLFLGVDDDNVVLTSKDAMVFFYKQPKVITSTLIK